METPVYMDRDQKTVYRYQPSRLTGRGGWVIAEPVRGMREPLSKPRLPNLVPREAQGQNFLEEFCLLLCQSLGIKKVGAWTRVHLLLAREDAFPRQLRFRFKKAFITPGMNFNRTGQLYYF